MKWKDRYLQVLTKVCMKPEDEFEIKTDQTMPKFYDLLIRNKDAQPNSLYSFELNEYAAEQDYKDFVEYIAGYINVSVNELLDMADGKKKGFATFKKKEN